MFELFEAKRAPLAVSGLSVALLMTALDTSLASTSLPALARAFGASFERAQWIVLAYLLAVTSLTVLAGRLGDIFGRRRAFLTGIALFTLTSALCALAPSLWWLVAARAVQGSCAAATMVLSYALAGDIPRVTTEKAMGRLAAMPALGTTLGPAVGSVADHFAPSAIFLVNVPLGAIAFVLALYYVPRRHQCPDAGTSFDVRGTVLMAVSLIAYALSMTLGGGLRNPLNAVLFAGAVCGVIAFVLTESRSASPLVPVAMFGNAVFSVSLASSAIVATVVMATLIVGPFYLSRGLGLGRAHVGIALSIGPAAAAITASVAGRLVERVGVSRAAVAGLSMMAFGGSLLVLLPSSAAILGYVVPLALMTSGYATFQTANNTAALATAGQVRRGVAAGLLTLSRNFGQITGASVMGAVFLHATGASDLSVSSPAAIAAGMRATMGVATLLIAAAIAVTTLTRNRARFSAVSLAPPRFVNAERKSPC